jgi:Glycosyl hydrolase family 12
MNRLAFSLVAGCLVACSSGGGSPESGDGGGSSSDGSSSGASSSGGSSSSSTSSSSSSGGSSGSSSSSSGGSSGASSSSGSSSGSSSSSGDAGATCANPTCTESNAQCNLSNNWDVFDNQWCCSPSCADQGQPCGPESIHVCSASSWYVESEEPANNTAVLTFPGVQENFGTGNGVAISSFTTMTSTYAFAIPDIGDYEMTYDIWVNGEASNGCTEIMIWVDNHGQTPAGSIVHPGVSVGGSTFDVWRDTSGSWQVISFETTGSFSKTASGSVDLLAIYDYVVAQGWMPSSSTLYQIGFGPEICSTGAQNETFYINDFTITSK